MPHGYFYGATNQKQLATLLQKVKPSESTGITFFQCVTDYACSYLQLSCRFFLTARQRPRNMNLQTL